jgi:hypothetical protein
MRLRLWRRGQCEHCLWRFDACVWVRGGSPPSRGAVAPGGGWVLICQAGLTGKQHRGVYVAG